MAFPEKTQKNLNSVRSKLSRYKVLLPLVLNIHEYAFYKISNVQILNNLFYKTQKKLKYFDVKKPLDVNTFKTLNSLPLQNMDFKF